MDSPSCIIVIVICSVLTHRLCLWLVSILRFFFPAVCVYSIERFLNLVAVLTSGTCGTAVLTKPQKVEEARVPRSDRIRLYIPFPVRSELVVLHHAVSGKRKLRTLLPSVHSSEPCVGIRSYHASDPLLVFAAVKKMAADFRLRGTVVQKSPMHAYSLVSLVSADVPRMSLCSSLLCNIRTCDPEVKAECPRMGLCLPCLL